MRSMYKQHNACAAKNELQQTKFTLILPSCSPQYMCGRDIEDFYHYLLECPIYLMPRQLILLALRNVIYI